MLTHTRVKAHERDICKKKFSLRGDLVKHFRIHSEEESYGCSKCEKWFTDIGNRDRHIGTHHKKLNSEQQLELKCEIPNSIVLHDFLNYIEIF